MAISTSNVEAVKQSIVGKLQRYNGITVAEANPQQLYKAVASSVRDQIMQKWMISKENRKVAASKRLYYMSVEFLTGRALNCNMINLCTQEEYAKAKCRSL